MSSSGLCKYPAHRWHTHIHTGRILNAHKIQILKSREAGQTLCSIDHQWSLSHEGQFGSIVVPPSLERSQNCFQNELSRLERVSLKPMRVQVVVVEPLWELCSLMEKSFKYVSVAMFTAVPCECVMTVEGCDACAFMGRAQRSW